MHRVRKRLLTAVLALPLLLGAVACGDEESAGDGGPIELSIYWWGAQAPP